MARGYRPGTVRGLSAHVEIINGRAPSRSPTLGWHSTASAARQGDGVAVSPPILGAPTQPSEMGVMVSDVPPPCSNQRHLAVLETLEINPRPLGSNLQ